ncbi:hypothetical protein FGADI_4346 [Fusarium gaditjirri]|uniref:Alcohol dehydrogenase n=1 Tax=Fusarium gaditjirri TaxID=282569 RepID=A0A8H4WZR7_9HYPO|nr:hypothetical protein FGADI_4346 [Fusarium gaditjirri]
MSKYPKVLGHEGAGFVEEVGLGVQVAAVGDPVLLSYDYCKKCDLCIAEQPSYCTSWSLLNIVGEQGSLERAANREDISGKFFGQSSFSAVAVVSETSVVNVKEAIKNEEELKLLAPLGCGLMTGSGAVMNAAHAKPDDIVLVTGLGAVGLAAIMAAKVVGCKEIIAVDRVASRLEIAQELGASKVLDTSKDGPDLATRISDLVNNQRIAYAIETTGAIPVINGALRALGKRGKLIQVGLPQPGAELTINLSEFLRQSNVYESHSMGGTTGSVMIPLMLQWYRNGKFPVEKLVSFVPVARFTEAVEGMKSGTMIKPILLW